MRFLIFLFLLAGIAYSQVPAIEPGVSQELAKWRAAHYSDVRYKLNLTLEKMSPVLKGGFELSAKVPAGWKMVSNSAEEDVHGVQVGPDGKSASETFLFEETLPISTYVFAFAVGDFQEFFGEITSTDSARRPDIK